MNITNLSDINIRGISETFWKMSFINQFAQSGGRIWG